MGATDTRPGGRKPRVPEPHKALMRFVWEYVAEHGVGPSIRDAQAALGYRSPNAVAVMVGRLRETGHLPPDDGRAKARATLVPVEVLAAARDFAGRTAAQWRGKT